MGQFADRLAAHGGEKAGIGAVVLADLGRVSGKQRDAAAAIDLDLDDGGIAHGRQRAVA